MTKAVQKYLTKSQAKQKAWYDRTACLRQFNPEDSTNFNADFNAQVSGPVARAIPNRCKAR